MELSPVLYRIFVKPKFFSRYFYHYILGSEFDFSRATVLDFGCGIGSSSVMFKASNYIGLDCDCKRIRYAKKIYPKHRFITYQDNKIPLKNKSIDYIVILSVLHHISDSQIKDYLKEFRSILKNNGKMLMIEPCLYKNTGISNWFMLHMDKGEYIRDKNNYLRLLKESNYDTRVNRKFTQMLLYNKIFMIARPRS